MRLLQSHLRELNVPCPLHCADESLQPKLLVQEANLQRDRHGPSCLLLYLYCEYHDKRFRQRPRRASSHLETSIRSLGRAKRKFSIGPSDWPPARSFASDPPRANAVSASGTSWARK